MESEEITFQTLREITDGFSEERKLSEGAFGVVYKGVTKNGEVVAVVKLRDAINFDYKQFQNKFHNLTMLKHQNIIQVLGYSYETEKKPMKYNGTHLHFQETQRAICLEYLQNGSLQKHLSDEFSGLNWHTRYSIIKGICEGLKYIQEELEEPFYYLDLRPDNILLDKDMLPRIAGFDLSKIFGEELTWITRRTLQTTGYQKPSEYIDGGEFCKKFHIFSLGVIIIKIVSGPEGRSKQVDMTNEEFVDLVKTKWRKRFLATLIGSSLEAYCLQVETCTQIALNCVEKDRQKMPDIVNIINKLTEIETVIYQLPQKGYHKTVSKMTVHTEAKKLRKEPRLMTGQFHHFNWMTTPMSSDLEFVGVGKTSLDVAEELIVGRKDEKTKVMVSLFEAMTLKITILPIYGIGGIGKTTFAKLIYNDTNFKNYSRVWVNVSRRFDMNKICNSIISQLSGKESQRNETHEIHSCLTKLLSGKKILIVLDDLWEDNRFHLEDLKASLNLGDSISTVVLVTTRRERVAEIICTNLKPYKMESLTDEMCWDIIQQRSGFKARDDKEYLMGIGKEIAMKCGGIPLAAQSLGFMLKSMNSYQWIEVKDSDIWNESITEDVSSPNHVLASLKLSYCSMDTCLRSCFTYCAIFPKGHLIDKYDIINQWSALDLIKPTKILSTMQVGEKNIAQLLGLSFLQYSVPPKISEVYHEGTLLFTMHDLVHDLAISLLDNEIILDQRKQGNTWGRTCRYALLTDCSSELELCSSSPERLQALRFHDCGKTELQGAAFAPAESLQVLDLSECIINKLPDSIGNLKQLRYLNAPRIKDQIVPRSITKLSKLKYLNLQGSTSVLALPESIGELDDLMHLDISHCSKLKRLPDSFRNLTKLVYLNLSRCSNVNSISESLGKLAELQFLNLSHCPNILLSDDVQLPQRGLHDIMGIFTNLRYLNLSGCFTVLNEQEMFRLIDCMATLYNLEHLDLSDNRSLASLPESIASLKKLHTLNLSGCIGLSKLPTALREMYCLKFLGLKDCISLGFSGVPQLQSSKVILPKFMVQSCDDLSTSNLVHLREANITDVLNISALENVKSAGEPQKIKLMAKTKITKLTFDWTPNAMRFVKDGKVLKHLVPPKTLKKFTLRGYHSENFPYWLMGIAYYVPNLVSVKMEDLPKCNSLPPLGQLQNLRKLVIRGMDSIIDIDESFYGGPRAFPQLRKFELSRMRNLQVWKTTYSFEEGMEELMSPNLEYLTINDCPMLKLIPCPPRALNWKIDGSDNVLSSWVDGANICASSSATVLDVSVKSCKVPIHKWKLLRHMPGLIKLSVERCSYLRSSSKEMNKGLSTLQSLSLKYNYQPELPEWLGQLTSLTDLLICGHPDIKAPLGIMKKLTSLKSLHLFHLQRMTTLPHWLVELTSLQVLEVWDCPKLINLQESMSHLTSLQTLAFRNCESISMLPEWLGDLQTLNEITIQNCMGIKFLPESIEKLTGLEELKIIGCPELMQWCQLNENKMKLRHIKTKNQKDHYIRRNHSMDSKIENTTLQRVNLTYAYLDEITNGFSEKRKIGQGAHGTVCWNQKDHYIRSNHSMNSKTEDTTLQPINLSYAYLYEITNGFSEKRKIGQGAHGAVYLGLSENGEEVAVKVLSGMLQQLDDMQFRNEFENHMKLNHPNIVQLVGYCYETQHIYVKYNGSPVFAEQRYKALCLEYLQNGSLQNHLCDEFHGLDWHTRYKIIKGICEGLKYLHGGIGKPIYHLDLKPDNILLDKNMEPKLADFGLSKMFHGDLTCITQSLVGTFGYLPPEYLQGNIVSNKLDIYSLGVVLIKTIAGPDGRSKSVEMPTKQFIDHVYGNWRKRLQVTCYGSLLEGYCKQVKRCAQLSLDCVENDRKKRPTIVAIIDELNELETHIELVNS